MKMITGKQRRGKNNLLFYMTKMPNVSLHRKDIFYVVIFNDETTSSCHATVKVG